MRIAWARNLTLLFFIAALSYGALNRQAIVDWWILRSYSPGPHIVALAEDTDMSDEGAHIFYVSQPALNQRTSFNTNCPFPDRSLVLGCYSNNRIYIFWVNDPQLEGIEEVTAAHEMLHAAYDRLSDSERDRIDGLLRDRFEKINDQRLKDTIAQYEEADPDSVPNELHSILGTEHRNLGAELEKHFSRYFNDREIVVKISEDYEKVFTKFQNQIKSYDTQLASLKKQIRTLESQLTSLSNNLDAEAARLDQLLADGNTSSYNAAVPGFNASVNQYNATLVSYQSLVAQHNNLVETRNSLVIEQNELVKNLDSKFEAK